MDGLMSTALGDSNNLHFLAFADDGLMRFRQPHRGWRLTVGRHLPDMDGERIDAWRAVVAGVQATMDDHHASNLHRFFPSVLDSHCDCVFDLQF